MPSILTLFAALMTLHACGAHLVVLAPPSKDDVYYGPVWSSLVPFYVDYATRINTYEVVTLIVRPEDVAHFVAAGIPKEWIIKDIIADPWIRDFSPVVPSKSIQFKYIGGETKAEAAYTQGVFNTFAAKYGIQMTKIPRYNDGGNVVDNNLDKAIVTDKFAIDNNLSRDQAKAVLQQALGMPTVIIVTADEPKLGHSDGMVSFPCKDTIFVTAFDEPLRTTVWNELRTGCPACKIVEVPTFVDESTYNGGYASSCGVYVNSVVTDNAIYVPQFRHAYDSAAVRLYQEHACGKAVVGVDATAVCKMGGSLRCLSWQVEGQNARYLE